MFNFSCLVNSSTYDYNSISAILSTVLGVHFGHVLIHMKDHSSRLLHWIGMGIALLVLGIITYGKIRSL
ncbi:hypothetical protein H5410_047898 [Solanum commersonii]|uniref:Uncharacterized protein n=1 Tax=Solanum commersonii TaxID=4109 RepID=A0A9J5XKD4_SOLCO|nr:hypothetical protein H5410_047898 [Solanum commersonii]